MGYCPLVVWCLPLVDLHHLCLTKRIQKTPSACSQSEGHLHFALIRLCLALLFIISITSDTELLTHQCRTTPLLSRHAMQRYFFREEAQGLQTKVQKRRLSATTTYFLVLRASLAPPRGQRAKKEQFFILSILVEMSICILC